MLYKVIITSKLDYGSQVYASASDCTLRRLDVLQNKYPRLSWSSVMYQGSATEASVPPLRLRPDELTLQCGSIVMTRRRHTTACHNNVNTSSGEASGPWPSQYTSSERILVWKCKTWTCWSERNYLPGNSQK